MIIYIPQGKGKDRKVELGEPIKAQMETHALRIIGKRWNGYLVIDFSQGETEYIKSIISAGVEGETPK